MRRYHSEGILGLMDARNAPIPTEPMPAAGDDMDALRRRPWIGYNVLDGFVRDRATKGLIVMANPSHPRHYEEESKRQIVQLWRYCCFRGWRFVVESLGE